MPPKRRERTAFACRDCGAQTPAWRGQCPQCQAWNTMEELSATSTAAGFAGAPQAVPVTMAKQQPRKRIVLATDSVFMRVLGGGIVPDSVNLLGGEPGCGKSSLLLRIAHGFAKPYRVLYVCAEETATQVATHAERMGLRAAHDAQVKVLATAALEDILAQMQHSDILVLDSIQTISSEHASGVPGSVSQVRYCASQLTMRARLTATTLFIVGHVTKGGDLAGPRVLEHLVDTSLMLEYTKDPRYRLVRSIKNRFGPTGEVGVYAMLADGIVEVRNPSAIFLARSMSGLSGSIVTALANGNAPLLIELQTLVNRKAVPAVRALGLDRDRVHMLLAVLQHHLRLDASNCEVFASAIGGVQATDAATDLPLLLSLMSSYADEALPQDWLAIGEVSLTGEIRPIANCQMRLREAARLGFKRALIPVKNQDKEDYGALKVQAVAHLKALPALLPWAAATG